MKIILVAAMTPQHVIGKNNAMLWHLPRDLKHFHAVSIGKSVIMGRKTLIDLGKPLTQRRNIIVTRQNDFSFSGCEIVHSLEAALALTRGESEVIIGGGGEIYALALPYATDLDITIVDTNLDGDAYFPAFDRHEWHEVFSEYHAPDAKHLYGLTFKRYERLSSAKPFP